MVVGIYIYTDTWILWDIWWRPNPSPGFGRPYSQIQAMHTNGTHQTSVQSTPFLQVADPGCDITYLAVYVYTLFG